MPRRTPPPLWTCPRCGARFVTRNLWHACGAHTVQALFAGKGPKPRALYRALLAMLRRCGPVAVHPAKTRIAFMVRVRFASVGRVSRGGLGLAFALLHPLDSPRVRVERIGRWHMHRLRLTDAAQLDAELQRWLCASYRLGRQDHRYGAPAAPPPRRRRPVPRAAAGPREAGVAGPRARGAGGPRGGGARVKPRRRR